MSTGVETKGKLGKRLASLRRANVGYERGVRKGMNNVGTPTKLIVTHYKSNVN